LCSNALEDRTINSRVEEIGEFGGDLSFLIYDLDFIFCVVMHRRTEPIIHELRSLGFGIHDLFFCVVMALEDGTKNSRVEFAEFGI
jgi:hypothetical protein